MPRFHGSAIVEAEYDPANRVLQLWFAEDDGPYTYRDVPPRVYTGLCTSPSKSDYFARVIRANYSRAA